MIEKLYNLKKNQTNQKLTQKAQIVAKVDKIDDEIISTKLKMDSATVDKFGAISDFAILSIHKNTMKMHISNLEKKKNSYNKEIEQLLKDIVKLQTESEQFDYLLKNEQKKKSDEDTTRRRK